ncbi:hypothetical protein [Methylobacterium brachythecii]|uniref:Uncharacterized protein n=1 Tax=Methylobacterium brachythecii TaxID=1176177 RepID=A0A7W6F9B4_9HYPH|nr:hypothetical protein [Methylobacterium brachythecii]MBB3905358.1 hypothetical protein [Methylobacterium brachythecii]GLS45896.1 hypothetical protein GCM10007884_38870 [Methylobacterium brachythecii]
MIERTSTAVEAIIHDALEKLHPRHLLAEAVRRTAKGSRWKGRLKLSREEALAATRVVTELVRQHGLKPTTVLQRDGSATTREQTYRFFLTEAEMATGTVALARPLAKGICAHVGNVRAVALAARAAGREVDEDSMMAELAEAVGGYLDQFREKVEREPHAEIAEDGSSIATWLGKASRRFELARCLAGADRLDLDFDRSTGEMSHVGRDVGAYAYGVMPWVPIRTRAVAEGDCVVHRRDEAERMEEARAKEEGSFLFFPSPRMHEVGRENAVICEKVGLGVNLERGKGLRMTFTIDHVVYAGTSFAEDWASEHPQLPRHLECAGIPERGNASAASDGIHYVEITSPLRNACPDFRAYVTEAFGEDSAMGIGEARYCRRFLPVTPETCRLLLDGGDRDALFAWRHFADLREETVLPLSAINDEGIESWLIQDRFAELLYDRSETGLAGLLQAEAVRRVEAYEAFLLNSESGEQRRKLEFRARMRS